MQHIKEVIVTSQLQRTIIPVQKLSGEQLRRLSVHSVADAMRYFSGVQIKDYGGIGGLKTVNIRSLGTNHTGVFYDGIELGNAQNGVVDLGRFSLDNMESVQLYNGQKSNIFQPAKDFSSASAVYMQSRVPTFKPGKRDNLNVALKAGSFDTFNPSLLWEHQLAEHLRTQLSAEWMTTSGKYRFRYAKKNGYDTTEVRRNGDVKALRAEASLYGILHRGNWKGKIYLYNSERGYPGAAVREEPGRFSHQDRQWDTNLFAQASFRQNFSDFYSLLLNAKAAYDYLHYLSDPRLDVTTMYTDNTYRQTELYFSASHLFNLRRWWNIALSNDIQYNYLDANLTNFVYPHRLTVLSALATSVQLQRFSAQASLLHSYTHDYVDETGGTTGTHSKITPTLALSYRPFEGVGGTFDQLSLRAFYKKIYRMPTFNDLYYTFVGNKSLKPESTTQYDIGATLTLQPRKTLWLRQAYFSTDVYYNTVDNKIVAMPSSNQFRWTMMNFGYCQIWGLDVSAKLDWRISQVDVSTHATYTWTRAMDKTEPESEFYGGQLPYIPWHSGSAIVSAAWRQWSANYSFIYTGERYESSANIAENYSQPWYTSDLSLTREFTLRKFTLRLTAEVNNIFNQQYEVVQCYPMPGTNFRIKANFIL
ncbi:MAG: TonB-dependent receptor [Prevotella sp.]|nr:TonB-dependent receptor [Prevotella sp.]